MEKNQIFYSDVCFDDWVKIRNVIRKELGYNSKRSCTNRDIKFLEVVNQLGEPPKGQGKSKRVDSKEYWGNFISLWNKGNSEKYSNWKSAEKHYKALSNKLKNRVKSVN